MPVIYETNEILSFASSIIFVIYKVDVCDVVTSHDEYSLVFLKAVTQYMLKLYVKEHKDRNMPWCTQTDV